MQRIILAILLQVLAAPAWGASNILTWQDNSNNETAFHVERKAEACTGTGAFAEIATTAANIATFTDAAVTEGLTYCYRVAASNTAGKSAFSNTAGRTVPFTVPAAPSGLGVTGGP
jgi:titin